MKKYSKSIFAIIIASAISGCAPSKYSMEYTLLVNGYQNPVVSEETSMMGQAFIYNCLGSEFTATAPNGDVVFGRVCSGNMFFPDDTLQIRITTPNKK